MVNLPAVGQHRGVDSTGDRDVRWRYVTTRLADPVQRMDDEAS